MFKKFCTDPNYLTKYHVKSCVFLVGIVSVLLTFKRPDPELLVWYIPLLFLMTSANIKWILVCCIYALAVGSYLLPLSLWNGVGLVAAVLLTFPFTGWLHSAAHGSIRPKWFGRLVGELMGLIQLSGFVDWHVTHVFHHSHPDHPVKDPHPPAGKTYWQFVTGMREAVGKSFFHHYFLYFEQSETAFSRLRWFMRMAKLNVFLKVSFWYLALGPQWFSFFFVPSIAFKMLHYAWFNYATHIPNDQGGVDIVNLDGHFYKLINWLGVGIYYHGNHHDRPNAFNPKYAKPRKAVNDQKEAA